MKNQSIARNQNAAAVYQWLRRVPAGKVVTYGQISNELNLHSARWVGQMIHRNPDPKTIPCHRVVFADGRLSPAYAFGGRRAQQAKLADEGVRLTRGKVDLKHYRFERR